MEATREHIELTGESQLFRIMDQFRQLRRDETGVPKDRHVTRPVVIELNDLLSSGQMDGGEGPVHQLLHEPR